MKKDDFIAICVLVIIIAAGFLLIHWAKSGMVEYSLNDYTCDEIKESILDGTCLYRLEGKLGGHCFGVDEMDLHYRYRCIEDGIS